MTIYSGFTHEKWWFSIVMLNYQRVSGFKHAELLGELWSPTSHCCRSEMHLMRHASPEKDRSAALRNCSFRRGDRTKYTSSWTAKRKGVNDHAELPLLQLKGSEGNGWESGGSIGLHSGNTQATKYTYSVAACSRWFAQRCKRNNSLRNLSPSRAGTWRVARRVCLKNAVPKANTHGKPFGLCDRINV